MGCSCSEEYAESAKTSFVSRGAIPRPYSASIGEHEGAGGRIGRDVVDNRGAGCRGIPAQGDLALQVVHSVVVIIFRLLVETILLALCGIPSSNYHHRENKHSPVP